MSSYIIVESNVIDADKLAQYGQLAAPTVAKFGGKFIARGAAHPLSGNQLYSKIAVIEFANQQQAQDWYQSDEYQALIELRNQAMDCNFQLVAGT